MKINTTPGETYIVLSTGGCTVTTGAGKQIKKLAAGQDFFTAMTGDSILSDDNASVTVAKGEILSMLNTDSTGSDVQATLRFQPVTSQSALPATGENGVIYLVPNGKTAPNQYTEWVWTGAAYEQLGDVSVDLSGYVSKADLGITSITSDASGPVIKSDAILSTSTLTTSAVTVSDIKGLQRLVPDGTLNIGSNICILTNNSSTEQTKLILGGHSEWSTEGIRYIHNIGPQEKEDVLYIGQSSMLTLLDGGEFRCGNDADGIRMYTNGSGVATLHIGSQAKVIGLSGGGGSDSGTSNDQVERLYTQHIRPINSAMPIEILARVTNVQSLGVENEIAASYLSIRNPNGASVIHLGPENKDETGVPELYLNEGVHITGPGWEETVEQIAAEAPTTLTEVSTLTFAQGAIIKGIRTDITVVGTLELAGAEKTGSSASLIIMESGTGIAGPGWDEIVSGIQAGAAAAAVAANDVPEEFTKLIFPPTGTATAEQDPSWITKSNILMETNGGQLNMTQLTATLAYAAQTPLAIAKRTLWLSTSSGTGDAVQWPANAVFPDDQLQDKIQQLNSNSTYWFDITYVGGSDTVLIRKICSWASTTGESGPTE